MLMQSPSPHGNRTLSFTMYIIIIHIPLVRNTWVEFQHQGQANPHWVNYTVQILYTNTDIYDVFTAFSASGSQKHIVL